MRLFAALGLPEGVRAELAHWTRHAVPVRHGARRLPASSLHLTLCFLGERPPNDVAIAGEVLERCAPYSTGRLALGAPVWLGPRRRRALAVEVHDPESRLCELAEELALGLGRALDWQEPPGRFRPHITVARLGAPGVAGELVLPPTPALAFTPRELVLYRSHLHPSGAEYDALVKVALHA